MKVIISTDIEGASGVVDFSQVRSGPRYEEARALLTHDVNAAVEGCVDAGATEVLVVDAHRAQPNLGLATLHPQAQLVSMGATGNRSYMAMAGIDRSFDLALLVGMHSAAHDAGGVLSHSYTLPAAFFEVRINGMSVGEPQIATGLAGAFDVPCGLLTGDDVTVQEYQKIWPGVDTVVVKYALDRTAARCLPLSTTGPLIRAGASRAVERARAGELTPWQFETPCELEIVCATSGIARRLAILPTARATDHRVVSFSASSFVDLYERLLACVYLSPTAQDPPPRDE